MNICQFKDVLKSVRATARPAVREEFQECFKHGYIFGMTLPSDYFEGKLLGWAGFDRFTCKIGQITL